MLKHCASISILLIVLLLVSGPASAQQQNPKITKNNFKVTMLSLGSGSSRFTYERAFSPKISAELTVGVIGWGWDWINHSDPSGVIIKFAPKYNLIPQASASSWLAGFYLKPEFLYADFDYNATVGAVISRNHTNQYALLAEFGYQLVVWNWFDFDIYCGVGPTWGSYNLNNYYHGFMIFPSDGHVGFTAGYRVGIAF